MKANLYLPWKSGLLALAALVSTICLIVPVSAQIRNPSQDFFEQGRERLEREIQQIQTNPDYSEENKQKPKSEPLLEVRPSPEISPNQQPREVETPQQKPNDVNGRMGNG